MEFLLTVAISQLFVVFFLLWNVFEASKSEKYLIFFLLLMFFHMVVKFIFYVIINNSFLFENIYSSFTLGYGPLLLLYVIEKGELRKNNQTKTLLHLAPFFLFTFFFTVAVIVYLWSSSKSILDLYQNSIKWIILPSILGYFAIILRILFSKKEQIKSIKWLKPPVIYLTISLIIVSIISILDIGIEKEIIRSIVYSAFIFLSLAVARHLSSRTRLAQPAGHKKTKSKYEKSGLKQEDAVWIVDTLQDLMLKENLHLNSELKLEDLAAKIQVPKHHITEALNSKLDKNFYQYVNEFRIDKAVELLGKDDEQSIIQIAYLSGFNSKTTFNTYFKKLKGKTPKEYRETVPRFHK